MAIKVVTNKSLIKKINRNIATMKTLYNQAVDAGEAKGKKFTTRGGK